jgi:hypothetical protein
MREQSEIKEVEVSDPIFLIRDKFDKIIRSYKLRYFDAINTPSPLGFQSEFNKDFELNDKLEAHDKDFKLFLANKINQAFRKPELIKKYFTTIDMDGSLIEYGRGSHGGNHAANVALYSKMLLKLYKKYEEYLPENLKKEVFEFNEEKEKDLEVLALMHDCARNNKLHNVSKPYQNELHDQDEYKNAFYVALMMRELGDSRFTGENISEDGLNLITNLSLKGSEYKDKSLMSKLIQSADNLSATRVASIVYNPDHSDVFHDFRKIQSEEGKKKILHEFNKLSHVISDYEFFGRSRYGGANNRLEFIENPLNVFNQRAMEVIEPFRLAIEDPSDLIPKEFATKIPLESYFVHVVNNRRYFGTAVQKLNDNKFLNATLIFKPDSEVGDAFINHYANVDWYKNCFFILDSEPVDGIIFLKGFQRDIGSDDIFNLGTFGNNDVEKIQNFAYQSYVEKNRIIFSFGCDTIDQLKKKLEEIMYRRTYPETDISDTKYMVLTPNSTFEPQRIGKNRYSGEYFGRYGVTLVRSPQLIHNECHVYAAIHNVLHVGIAKDFLQSEKIDNSTNILDLKKIITLRDAVRFKEEINDEKKRLSELEEPMEDKNFKFCVNHEFKRVTTCLEKIVYFKRLRDQIEWGTYSNVERVSNVRKGVKQTEFEGGKFEYRNKNRAIWFDKKIDKIGKILISLTKELKSYEKSHDITGLTAFASSLDYNDGANSQKQINSWIDEIMEGKTEQKAVEKVINKIKVKLCEEVKTVAQDMCDPNNLIVIDDEKYLESDTKIEAVKKKIKLHKDKLEPAEIEKDSDLLGFVIFLNAKCGLDIIYKICPDENDRNNSFNRLKLKNSQLTEDTFNDFALNKIIENRDINSLLYLLNTDFIQSEDYKRFPLINVLEGCSNISKVEELMNLLTEKGLEIDINQKDRNDLTILDKMLPTCTAKSLKELLDLGLETSSNEAIEAILKSKKESVKQVIFKNDKLRNGLSIESLKLDAKYNDFFEKLTNGDQVIIDQVRTAFEDYVSNKSPVHKFKFDDKEILLNVSKIVEFLEKRVEADQVRCPAFSFTIFRKKTEATIYQNIEKNLNEILKQEFKSSFDRVKNALQENSSTISPGSISSSSIAISIAPIPAQVNSMGNG